MGTRIFSIGSKIYGGFMLIAALVLILGGISWFHMQSFERIASTRIMEKADARGISMDMIIKVGYVSNLAEEYFTPAGDERRGAIRVIVNDQLRTLREYTRVFAARELTGDEKRMFEQFGKVFREYGDGLLRAMEGVDNVGIRSPETRILVEEFRNRHRQIIGLLQELTHHEGELMYGSWNDARGGLHAVSGYILMVTLFTFLLCVLLAIFIARSIKRPIHELVSVLQTYERGDFSVRPHLKSRDEIEFFAHKFNEMLDQLQAAHQRLHDTIDFLPDATFVIDRERKVIAWNRAIEAMTGVLSEEVIGKGNFAYAVPFYGKPRPILVDLVFGPDPALEAEYPSIERKGHALYAEITTPRLLENTDVTIWAIAGPLYDKEGELVGAIESIRDITDRKRLEEQFRQAQKMQAVGNLAGGVAHDFNNILTAIIGYACLLERKISETDLCRSYVEQILTSSEKAAQLVRSLLSFSRKEVSNLKPVQINKVVRSIEKLLMRLIGEDIEFRTVLADAELMVMADAGQIEQVLMNLVTNARDAMPRGGKLLIETRVSDLDRMYLQAHEKVKPGTYVLIAVSDTGVGMDAGTRERIFEPFFTTKESGKGTGLGLAISYGIIKQHNGVIDVYSEPGAGTTFKIYLPLLASATEPLEATKVPFGEEIGGHECILLAEDEESVRSFMSSILKDFGYRVIVAANGEEAVARFREYSGEIDCLLFDVMMPKKNGREAFQEIRRLAPGIRALFMSGYTVEMLKNKELLDDEEDFLPKPVMPQLLLRKLRTLLEPHAGGPDHNHERT